MYPKTRDLQIVCNLVWPSKSQNDDRANIVGICDVPSTTLNWDRFKSYLVKNSGSTATDIKVSYITSDEKEVPINDQNDFQLALYFFRWRARIGEIITLKVDKVTTCKLISPLVQSSDAEIQTHNYKDEATQQTNGHHYLDDETPPKWFNKHMKKFEKKILDDIKQQFALNYYKTTHTTPYYSNSSRTKKPESHKRSRKIEVVKLNLDKDMCKKYAFKLDEPEVIHRPSLKTKSKKLNKINKISSDSDVCANELSKKLRQLAPTPQVATAVEHSPPTSQKSMNFFFTDLSCPLNDVLLVSSSDERAGPLYTNSDYLQKWEVTNAGVSAWDENTELRYAWGSEKLRPTMTILKCPELQPGEKGEITVWFRIPSTSGSYECFWHFYDCGRRFGRWIGCQLNVIDYPRKHHPSYATQPLDVTTSHSTVASAITSCVPSVDTMIAAAKLDPIDLSLSAVSTYAPSPSTPASLSSVQSHPSKQNSKSFETKRFAQVENSVDDSDVANKGTNTNNLDNSSIQFNSQSQSQSNCEPSSDSDNISILSGAQTPRSGSSDYVVIPSPNSSVDETNSFLVPQKAESALTISAVNLIIPSVDEDVGVEHNNGQLLVQSDASNNNLDAVSVASEAKSEPAADICEEGDVEEELRCIQNLKMADVQHEQTEYAYIYYNGEKYPFRKDFLREDYFNEAEKCAQSSGSVSLSSRLSKSSVQLHDPKVEIVVCGNVVAGTTMDGRCSRIRHGSTSSQESGKRLFVFPRHSPGFEVVYPAKSTCAEQPSSSATSAGTADSGFHFEGDEYFSIKDEFQFLAAGEDQFYTNRAPSAPANSAAANVESVESFSLQELLENGEREAQHMPSTTDFAHTAQASAPTGNSEVFSPSPVVGRNETSSVDNQRFNGRVYHPSLVQPGKRENVMTAAFLAGSAMGSVRNMVNKVLSTGNGKWMNGHWVAEGGNTKRENGLKILAEMGFMNRDLNATLLARYNDDVHRVISELVQ